MSPLINPFRGTPPSPLQSLSKLRREAVCSLVVLPDVLKYRRVSFLDRHSLSKRSSLLGEKKEDEVFIRQLCVNIRFEAKVRMFIRATDHPKIDSI